MMYLRFIGDVILFLVLTLIAIAESLVKFFIPKRYRMKNIDGEIALVTGGGGGLGRLLSLRLANLGAIVVVWDINEAGIEETVRLVRAAGGICYGYICDLCDREDIYNKAKILQEEVGKVSILINNAGIVTGMKFLSTPDKMIIRTMDVNIMSHFWTAKAFLPAMMQANKGHIVNVASLAGYCGISKLVDYCTSKAAAVGFEESLRMELNSQGYNINTTVVCPYFICSTGMFEDVQSRYISKLSPNDVAEKIVTAFRCNEKCVIIPSYLQILLALKHLFPYNCSEMFLRGIVQDISTSNQSYDSVTKEEKEKLFKVPTSKDQNSSTIHQQLTRVSSSERKP